MLCAHWDRFWLSFNVLFTPVRYDWVCAVCPPNYEDILNNQIELKRRKKTGVSLVENNNNNKASNKYGQLHTCICTEYENASYFFYYIPLFKKSSNIWYYRKTILKLLGLRTYEIPQIIIRLRLTLKALGKTAADDNLMLLSFYKIEIKKDEQNVVCFSCA